LNDFQIWSKNLYRLNQGVDHSNYMSDTACLDAEKINDAGADFLNDKSRLRERIPTDWLIKEYGVVENSSCISYTDDDDLFPSLIGKSCIVKDVSESNGNSIKFISKLDDFDIEEIIQDSKNKKFLVSEWAIQHDYAKNVFAQGSNSLRFVVYSPEGESSRITACVQKWSTRHSGIADNWNRGGLTTTVINGVMLDTMEDFTRVGDRGGNGSTREPMYPTIPHRFSYHPESGKKIMGNSIPFWNEAVQMVLDSSEVLRKELPYIGWDVIITEDGPKIIEGNPWPGIQLIQVHFPLFGDLGFREFMESHNVKGI
jgi:hypothetical protein